MSHHAPNLEHLALTRREFLTRCGMGMGALGLTGLMGGLGGSAQAQEGIASPLALKQSQFLGKAKRVIHIFANGGPSHVDTFRPQARTCGVRGEAASGEESRDGTQDWRGISLSFQV